MFAFLYHGLDIDIFMESEREITCLNDDSTTMSRTDRP